MTKQVATDIVRPYKADMPRPQSSSSSVLSAPEYFAILTMGPGASRGAVEKTRANCDMFRYSYVASGFASATGEYGAGSPDKARAGAGRDGRRSRAPQTGPNSRA